MPTYVGQVKYKESRKRSGSKELEVGRAARALTDTHGGRILSIYWMEGAPNMLVTFEGRNEAQAIKVFRDLETQQKVSIQIVRALTEGEKERAIQRRPS
jgi:uncharacterized protein with GYD domain